MILRRWTSLFGCALLAAGCVEFKAPLCTPELRADIPNFEGSYEMKMFDPSSLSVQKTETQFVRVGKGDYRVAGQPGDVYICQIDGHYLMEGTDDKSGNPQIYGIERRADGGFNLIMYAADSHALQAAGISFSAIDDPQPGPSSSPDVLNRKLLIENVGHDSQQIFQLLDEMGVRIAFLRTNSTGKDQKSSGKSVGSVP